ncbi:MAG: DoxX family protein [Flammeovirgaceae bacterium]|nr:DoxX family protein [Flammeovirgaceae bacterium]
MKVLKEFSRYFVGGLFIFSGLIKVNDPVGTAIKLEEYFEVFAYDFAPFFEWFVPASLFLSVFLSVLEVILGIALIIGYRMKTTAWSLLVMIIFFTFLTFYSAYFDKVTDCGCFGDAIKLTPWQSFIKDVILCVFIGVIFYHKNGYKAFFVERTGTTSIFSVTALFILVAIMAIRHLPFIDFRSYAIGNDLAALMRPSGELIYEYVMEKDGIEFRFDQYPTDETYSFKEMVIVNPEVQPKITDLAVWKEGNDYTEELFLGNKLLVIIQSINKTSEQPFESIRDLQNTLKNTTMWALTSANKEEYEQLSKSAQWNFPYFFTDATVLKTIIRSSPGIVLLKEGVVVGKWHFNDAPTAGEIESLL